MKVGLPVAGYHRGNPADFLAAELNSREGIEATILTQEEFEDVYSKKTYNTYICVDSGVPLKLHTALSEYKDLSNVSYWFIDFRHNKENPARDPNDLTTAIFLHERGGTLLQAQYEDVEFCKSQGLNNSHWMPLAADTQVWKPDRSATKTHDIGFIGNVWDKARAQVLTALQREKGIETLFLTPTKENPGLWKSQAAAALSKCRIGFNINSFYGTKYCYDVNMRFFETLSCGLPLITNAVPSLKRLFPEPPVFIRTFDAPDQIIPCIMSALSSDDFLSSGPLARDYVCQKASYTVRTDEILELIR